MGTFLLIALMNMNAIIVDVYESPPCVIINAEGKPQGFDIDLWEAVAKDLNLEFEYNKVDRFAKLLPRLASKQSDVALAGMTINSNRETIIDFSHSYLPSGLGVLVRSEDGTFLSALLSSSVVDALIKVLIFLILASHIVWFFERGSDAFNDKYFPGIFEGVWWSIVTMTTVGYGDKVPKKWLSRVFAVFIMVSGIYLFGVIISSVVFEKKSEITCKEDLEGRTVVTVDGTTSVPSIVKIGCDTIVLTKNINDAYEKLLNNEVKAVVFDIPMLKYYASKTNKAELTSILFDKQDYGFGLQHNSVLRKKINVSLLKLRENGKYDEYYKKWFGKE